MYIGYARVSTRSQGDSLDTQERILKDHGCQLVFRDTISGAKASRPGFDQMMMQVRENDVIYATRLDRLGRTALDTLKVIDDLTKRGVAVVLLRPEIDTRTKEGKLMAGVMSHLAEFERDLLIERTHEGLAAARQRGHHGGRPAKISAAKQIELARMVDSGMSVAHAAELLSISRSHAYRLLGQRPLSG